MGSKILLRNVEIECETRGQQLHQTVRKSGKNGAEIYPGIYNAEIAITLGYSYVNLFFYVCESGAISVKVGM